MNAFTKDLLAFKKTVLHSRKCFEKFKSEYESKPCDTDLDRQLNRWGAIRMRGQIELCNNVLADFNEIFQDYLKEGN